MLKPLCEQVCCCSPSGGGQSQMLHPTPADSLLAFGRAGKFGGPCWASASRREQIPRVLCLLVQQPHQPNVGGARAVEEELLLGEALPHGRAPRGSGPGKTAVFGHPGPVGSWEHAQTLGPPKREPKQQKAGLPTLLPTCSWLRAIPPSLPYLQEEPCTCCEENPENWPNEVAQQRPRKDAP